MVCTGGEDERNGGIKRGERRGEGSERGRDWVTEGAIDIKRQRKIRRTTFNIILSKLYFSTESILLSS